MIYSAELTGPRIRAISVLTGPYTVFLNYLGDGSNHPFRDACHPLWASQLLRALWPYVVVYGDNHRSRLWSSALHWAMYYWFYNVTLFCFYNTIIFFSRVLIFKVCSIDAVVLCVFRYSVVLLLYMSLFWIKRSGLVTLPGGAANPQFPTRPHTYPASHITHHILHVNL